MAAEPQNVAGSESFGLASSLLQTLVPRARSFSYYDLERACIWNSEGADDFEIDNYVAGLPDDVLSGNEPDPELLRRTLTSGRTLLILVVCGDGNRALGLLVTAFSRNDGKASSFDPQTLKATMRPVAQFIGESLGLRARLDTAVSRAEEAEQELKLVYQVDEKIHGTSRSHSSLAQLVGHSGRFLGIAYSVLLMPLKRIRISATHSSWKNVNR
jgi:hypothetical protein